MAKDKEEKKDGGAAKAELTPEEAAAKAKKKKLILFGAIGLVVVVGGAGAAMMLMGGGKKKDAAQEESASPTASPTADAELKGEPGKTAAGEKPADGKAAPADGKGDPAKTADAKDSGKDESKLNIDFGQTYTFAPFHLNLGNPIDNRYVRLEVAVEYLGGPEQEEELKRRMPQLRDAVVSVTARKTREFLLGPDGKDQLRLEIKNRINQYMSKKIENVYITDILIE
jgi:flagellar FliL protein